MTTIDDANELIDNLESKTDAALIALNLLSDESCAMRDLVKILESTYDQIVLLDDYLHDKESCSTVETLTIKKMVKAIKGGI